MEAPHEVRPDLKRAERAQRAAVLGVSVVDRAEGARDRGRRGKPPVEHGVIEVECRVLALRPVEERKVHGARGRRLVGNVRLGRVAAMARGARRPQDFAELRRQVSSGAPLGQPEWRVRHVGEHKVAVPEDIVPCDEHQLVCLSLGELQCRLDRQVLAGHPVQPRVNGLVLAARGLVQLVEQLPELRIPRVNVDVELDAGSAVGLDYALPRDTVQEAHEALERGVWNAGKVPSRLLRGPRRLPAS